MTPDAEHAAVLRRWVKATRYADEPVHTHDMIPAVERAIEVLEREAPPVIQGWDWNKIAREGHQ